MEQQHHRSRRKQWSNHLLPAYNTLMTSAGANSTKLVVFIDDLDRVQPSKIVEVLAAVNLVLTAAGITTVIGMVSALAKQLTMRACTDEALHYTRQHAWMLGIHTSINNNFCTAAASVAQHMCYAAWCTCAALD